MPLCNSHLKGQGWLVAKNNNEAKWFYKSDTCVGADYSTGVGQFRWGQPQSSLGEEGNPWNYT